MGRGRHKGSFNKKRGSHRKKKSFSEKHLKTYSSEIVTHDTNSKKRINHIAERNVSYAKTKKSVRSEDLNIDSGSSEEENDYRQLLSTLNEVSNAERLAVGSDDEFISSEEEGTQESSLPGREVFLNKNIASKASSQITDPERKRPGDIPSSQNANEVASTDEEKDYYNNECEVDGKGNSGIEDKSDRKYIEEEEEEEEEEEAEEDNLLDPFITHFNFELDSSLLGAVTEEPPHVIRSHVKWPVLGNLTVTLPCSIETSTSDKFGEGKISISEQKTFAKQGTVLKIVEGPGWPKFYVKSQIQNNLTKANYCNLKTDETKEIISLTPLQRELFSVIFKYQDLYFPERTLNNCEQIKFVYCLHAINHILKTRLKIVHHNAKLLKKQEVPDEFRDQGLVRPKVLIIVPFRHSAYRIVQMMISILLPDEKANVINKSRFFAEYTGESIAMPKKNPKPEDYELTFAGNTDDNFRIGLSVTKKSLKLYADFYSADIIIASPLGLRVVIGAEGEKERDFDFLSSIEVLILDQTEIFLMQNWDHLLHVMEHLHLQPRTTHGTDFSRVHMWAINGWTKFYRQSIIFSSVNLPEITSLLNHHCRNYGGRVFVENPATTGAVSGVVVQVPQVFNKFDASSPLDAIDERFSHFVKKILPQYKDSIMNHTLIYIPSYFDFVKVRNFFKAEDINFVQLCEYSKEGKMARARDMFFHSSAHFLLYSERLHFFRRLHIKGIRHIIFYQLPTFPHFYTEMCNLMQEANQNKDGGNESNMTVTALYSKYDAQRLSPIVGFGRAVRMISSQKNVQMLLTGE
ncbi:U3 small nucleolar RNA-associated protein 25 homolog [Schistocerca cancellata]|uniref:U3 small nucleolar RNA-associated protein 25 homolog n=1 Tax=Schistocerca cancellata TaxID=274614 RepID=UPI0021176B43|nr:U3 small nucleolar RNA-associated protein 25 homolog [Schistocerca cancellata]